jgi:U3 small nucleolar RNA-associated protein 13
VGVGGRVTADSGMVCVVLCGAVGCRQLLEYIREWNTNAKHCHVAHRTLRAILSAVGPQTLKQLPQINEILASLVSTTRYHSLPLSL